MIRSTVKRCISKVPLFRKTYRLISGWHKSLSRSFDYRNNYKLFIKKYTLSNRFEELPINTKDQKQMLKDNTNSTGFDHHYVYHTAWAARKLVETKPEEHIDIGSHHYFSTLVSAFIPLFFYDYRPAPIELSNLKIGHVDLTQLSFEDESIQSLSCMHVVEHIGLGRYGDPIDPDGDIKAMDELIRVLAPQGHLLFVVPIGKPRICFNAHRIYNPIWINEYFAKNHLVLNEFAVIPDTGNLLRYQSPDNYTDQKYACGCYAFVKRT